MGKKRTPEQIKSRRMFLQGGAALGAMSPLLFANNVQTNKKIRLIGFRLGHLDTPKTKQTRLLSMIEEE